MAVGTFVAFGERGERSALATMTFQWEHFCYTAVKAEGLICKSPLVGEIGTIDGLLAKSPLLEDLNAVKSGNVYLGFADRFTGTLIITGEIPDVTSALTEVVDFFRDSLGYVVCNITKK